MERDTAACCVRELRRVFPAAMPRCTSHASDIGFSRRHFPAADAAAEHRLFRAWSFSAVSQRQKTLPVWVIVLWWVLASSIVITVFITAAAAATTITTNTTRWRGGAMGRALDLRSTGRGFNSCSGQSCVTTLGKLFTPMCLCHQAV